MATRGAFLVETPTGGAHNIREGNIKDFAAVNIFVGRNDTGKSSILEALYIFHDLQGNGFAFAVSSP